MEEKINQSIIQEKSKINDSHSLNKVKNHSKTFESDDEELNYRNKNIRNNLDTVFSDLDSLRNSLKSIKYKKENQINESEKNFSNKNNISDLSSSKRNIYLSTLNDSRYNDFDGNVASRSRSKSNDRNCRNRSYLNNKADKYDYYRTPRSNC